MLVGLQLKTTYADLCRLTRLYVSKAGAADSLCEKLATAEQAKAEGDLKTKENAIRSYLNELRAQSAKAITAERPQFLIDIAATL